MTVAKGTTVDPRLAGLDRFIRRGMRHWQVPGCAVGVVERGRVIHAKGYGLSDPKRGAPADADTRFIIASCTKSFTATSVGILVDEGALDWDKPVRKYWPSFRMHDPVVSERMTPRDLLSHRCGLPRHDWAWINSPFSRAELCRRLRHLRPSKDFRELYQYNNLMYMAAGFLIEQVTGLTWEQFVQKRLLDPVGMRETRVVTDGTFGSYALATPHTREGRRVFPALRGWLRKAGLVSLYGPVAPAGGLVSTALDMCRWLGLQMNGGKIGRRQIISAKNLGEIHRPQMVVPDSGEHPELLDPAYAMGWTVQPYRGRRWIGHTGSFVGFNSRTSFLPREKIGVVVLTNVSSSPLITAVPLHLLDCMLGLDPIPWTARMNRAEKKAAAEQKKPRRRRGKRRPSHRLAQYVGEYANAGYGRVVVCRERRGLMLEYHGARSPLVHHDGDVFRMSRIMAGVPIWEATFRTGRTGRVTSVAIPMEPAVKPIVFRRERRR